MKTPTKRQIVFEAVMVAGTGVALSALLYSEPFRECCKNTIGMVIAILFLPSQIIVMLFWGVHSATPVQITAGLVTQLLVMWAITRLVLAHKARRTAQANAANRRKARSG